MPKNGSILLTLVQLASLNLPRALLLALAICTTVIPQELQAQTTVQKKCSKCDKTVSSDSKPGDNCPHCGVRWSSEGEQSIISRAVDYPKGVVYGLLCLIGILIPIALEVLILQWVVTGSWKSVETRFPRAAPILLPLIFGIASAILAVGFAKFFQRIDLFFPESGSRVLRGAVFLTVVTNVIVMGLCSFGCVVLLMTCLVCGAMDVCQMTARNIFPTKVFLWFYPESVVPVSKAAKWSVAWAWATMLCGPLTVWLGVMSGIVGLLEITFSFGKIRGWGKALFGVVGSIAFCIGWFKVIKILGLE